MMELIVKNISIAVALLLVSCGAGGSVTDLDGLSVRFMPDQLSLPPNSVSLREGQILGDIATLEVWGETIALPAFRTTFTIRFAPASVEFVGFERGDFFEQQALPANVAYIVPIPASGTDRLNVEIIKSGTALGSQQDGVFLKLQFRVRVLGTSALTFENPILADANGLGAQNVAWIGGQLEGF